ncbi:MAG: hypothetical protein OXF19_04720, partial [Hyphomicrobiales bacterium]|nr:hypothetical protein [Hyphomicrobiales bacterium]
MTHAESDVKKRPGRSSEMPGRPLGWFADTARRSRLHRKLKLFPDNPGTYKRLLRDFLRYF